MGSLLHTGLKRAGSRPCLRARSLSENRQKVWPSPIALLFLLPPRACEAQSNSRGKQNGCCITIMASSMASSVLKSSSMKWAAGGWTFFIAENLILSENRTYLIDALGDQGYHALYGTLSTIATASIGYGYLYKIPKNAPPLLWKGAVPLSSRVAAWAFLSLGASMASQTLPKLQIPLAYVQSNGGSNANKNTVGPSVAPETSEAQWKVQCPFDFTDSKAGTSENEPHGLDRISRHPGLWSMAFMCVGQGCLLPSLPQKVWWTMPLFVAWIGGSHTDSRYRRNMGGTLTPEYDAMTSNVPFVALIKNGGWKELGTEAKPLNALLATGIATVYVLRRGRVPASLIKTAAIR